MPCKCCCCYCCCSRKKDLDEITDIETEDIDFQIPQHSQAGGDADAVEPPTTNITTETDANLNRWNIAIYEDDDPHYNYILKEAEAAIENEILPHRISQGSSGSYFVKNPDGANIGVFKPRDEEPYGSMNPKWGKWFQRKCCPCCFGRGCLIPNTGYLSEAGAYLVDVKFGLNVVPKTKVIRMASSTFHYGKIKRKTAKAKRNFADKFPTVGKRFHRIGLPLKMGSFQVFVTGYKDAIQWIHYFESHQLEPSEAYEFQLEFEKLVILDYIIRNTDRGNDNWLIKYEKRSSIISSSGSEGGISVASYSPEARAEKKVRVIKIAAIDNGLAFPFKHPDEWRTYPFQWAKLPFAKVPFSVYSREKYLPLLSNISLIEDLCNDLYYLFSLDKHFHRHIFEKQMSVLRGQILNLANALRELKSPFQLTQMAPLRVLKASTLPQETPKHAATSINKATSSVHGHGPNIMKLSASNTLMFDSEEYKPEVSHDNPRFSNW